MGTAEVPENQASEEAGSEADLGGIGERLKYLKNVGVVVGGLATLFPIVSALTDKVPVATFHAVAEGGWDGALVEVPAGLLKAFTSVGSALFLFGLVVVSERLAKRISLFKLAILATFVAMLCSGLFFAGNRSTRIELARAADAEVQKGAPGVAETLPAREAAAARVRQSPTSDSWNDMFIGAYYFTFFVGLSLAFALFGLDAFYQKKEAALRAARSKKKPVPAPGPRGH
jgi:hypothetical protein